MCGGRRFICGQWWTANATNGGRENGQFQEFFLIAKVSVWRWRVDGKFVQKLSEL